jgi:hypothetical protein
MTGTQGSTGATGAQGVQGIAGTAVNTGATGTQGVQGFTGLAGFAVWTGAQGVQGMTGAQGFATNTGAQGASGPQGIQGLVGFAVWTGATGIVGAQGAQGNQGHTGVQGFTGITGVQGATGTVAILNQNPLSATGTSLGFTGDYNNVYYRQSTSTLNYITGFIQPAASFGLNNGYVGQTLTIQSAAPSGSINIAGAFMDSGATGANVSVPVNGVVSSVFNGTQWVLLYRSTGVTGPV